MAAGKGLRSVLHQRVNCAFTPFHAKRTDTYSSTTQRH